MDIEYRKIEREELKRSLFGQYHAIRSSYFSSFRPDDQPLTEERVRLWLEDEENETFSRYLFAFMGSEIVGYMEIGGNKPGSIDYELNKDLGWLDGYVYTRHRRQGIAKGLAKAALESAKGCGLDKLTASAFEEGGNKFCESLGGALVSRFSDRILHLEGFDWSLADRWLKIKDRLGQSWAIDFHAKITDSFIEDIVDLDQEIIHELRTMGNNEFRSTREGCINNWKENAKWMEKTGDSYACFIIKDSSGKAVGFTEGGFSKDNPAKFFQYVTGVTKTSRGLGLGKLLKALMLDYIRKEHPEIKTIKTGSNDLNAQMHGINNLLGFTAGFTYSSYSFSVVGALERLGSQNGD